MGIESTSSESYLVRCTVHICAEVIPISSANIVKGKDKGLAPTLILMYIGLVNVVFKMSLCIPVIYNVQPSEILVLILRRK